MQGPDAAAYLNRMLSNEIEGLASGASCEAMLLTPKARVIALLAVYRRGPDDVLLITEPELAEPVAAALLKARFAAKVEIALETHDSYVLLGAEPQASDVIVIASAEFGPGYEVIGAEPPSELPALSDDEAEGRRIAAGMPRHGREIDERVLPAEAGLIERTVDFKKGCYPGQEPIARLHYRGHTNRGLRVLRLDADVLPERDSDIMLEGKTVGRITSAALREGGVIALAYLRNEVEADALLEVGGVRASMIEPARP